MLRIVCLLGLIALSSGYLISTTKSNGRIAALQALPSYEEMMEEAKKRKEQKRSRPPRAKTTQAPSSAPEPAMKVDIPGYEAPRSDGLPFSDEIYEQMKYIIEKLTRKIKDDESLTQEELTKLSSAVEIVIGDALGKPVPEVKSKPSKPKKANPNPPIIADFSAPVTSSVPSPSTAADGSPYVPDNLKQITPDLLGDDHAANDSLLFKESFGKLGSSWQVDGMDNIDDPDEYYKHINKRSAAIRQLRGRYASRESADDYRAQLSGKKSK